MISNGATETFPGVRSSADRRSHFRALVAVAEGSLRADGAACWLDDDLSPVSDRPVETWITARMAHVLGLGSLLGVPGASDALSSALDGLSNVLADDEHGGWLASSGPGVGQVDGLKQAYAHAFVVLAASTGVAAGVGSARPLLAGALEVLDRRFWESDRGLHLDERSRDWGSIDSYRGVNSNMHAVEALLAAFDVTGDREWLGRAATIGDHVIGWARPNQWRIPEHFDSAWNVLLDYNADRPRDPFKPFGATPGHGLEWARLLLQIDVAAQTPGRRLDAAEELYRRAVVDGWSRPEGGFVYTTDWSGDPVEARRFHWVAAEAVAAADVLERVSGNRGYGQDAASWWDWIDANLVDHGRGSWFHELDTANHPSGRTWVGKPDVYHAAQAVILPELPLAGSFAGAAGAARGLLAEDGPGSD